MFQTDTYIYKLKPIKLSHLRKLTKNKLINLYIIFKIIRNRIRKKITTSLYSYSN